jgi:HPr kinase/phosphorylase
MTSVRDETLHATCVALRGQAVVLLGPSGSGKSALALQLMAMGCDLVADDRTLIRRDGDIPVARSPETIAGLIEARGIGILTAETVPSACVKLAVDLASVAQTRLPPAKSIKLAGCDVPLICGLDGPHFAAAILQILKSSLSDR